MRIHIVRVASALTLFGSVMLTTVAAGQSTVAVNGQVKGRQGEPKQFASVSIEGPGRYVAMTNTEGAFTIQNVIPGKYTVRVRQGDLVEVFTRDVGSGRVDLVVKW